MENGVVQATAHYVEEVMGGEGFRYVSVIVANCKMLALEQNERLDAEEVDMDALVLAGYLHDISTVAHGFHNHQLKSAEMAVEFLQARDVPEEQIRKVQQAILSHQTPVPPEERYTVPIEGRILYDADNLGRLSGLSVVTSLIEFGARYPGRAVTSEVLAAILRHIEERFVELYQSLNTQSAREMAREKFGGTLAFLDGVIEHVSDATPI